MPFSPEAPLSGLGRRLEPDETLWYRRTVRLPEGFVRDRVLLHFGAVDQDARVWVDGTLVLYSLGHLVFQPWGTAFANSPDDLILEHAGTVGSAAPEAAWPAAGSAAGSSRARSGRPTRE